MTGTGRSVAAEPAPAGPRGDGTASVLEALAAGLREAAAAAGVPVQVPTVPGLLTVFFSAEPVHDFAAAQGCDIAAHAGWCRELLARGVYPPPSQFEAWFPSLAHRPEHVERTVAAAAEAFQSVARWSVR